MKKTGKEAVRQRKIHMILIIILIIILAAAVGGYYLIQQTKAVTPRNSEGSSARRTVILWNTRVRLTNIMIISAITCFWELIPEIR